ncbi:MAG: hypothetical protein IPJ56_11460 [Gemmatimonadetes bacterium]|nr:hypothetical protein [Gemmatimonadota bacterium]
MAILRPTHLLALPLLALTACGGDATAPGSGSTNTPGNPTPAVRNVPGSYSRTVTIGGVTREFIVYVGNSVGATSAAPVVFMFHGSGQSGPQFYNISRWKETADAHGLIAVFPSALTYCYKEDLNADGDMSDAGETTVETKWTSGRLNTAERPLCTAAEVATRPSAERALLAHPFQEDLAFVDSMLVALQAGFVVNAKRIHGTGFSNGAQFVTRLVAERSSVFASLHTHGGATEIVSTAARAISVNGSLGNMDQHIQEAYDIPALPMTQDMFTRYPGVKLKYVLPMLSMLRLQDISTFQQSTMNGKLVSQWTWRTSAAGASNTFTFSLVGDNDHAYPNGILHPIVIAEPLWQFFSTQLLP